MAFREVLSRLVAAPPQPFAGNSSGNAPALLMLGGFKFSLNTAAFQQMERSTSWRWSAQERVGAHDALQFTGPADDRITLPGVIYPDFKGGAGQLDAMRALGGQGHPLRLVAATGEMLGLWVIESVAETASEFKADGKPRKQEFSLTIRKFGDDNL